MTNINVISGFLGAGKTTLIKGLLQDALAGQQVVLIENEFGEIGIDGGFLKNAGIEIREMNSGCICCSLVGDFGTALKEVVDTYHPDRIIIEPSGVGKLSDVIHAIEENAEEAGLVLDSAATVVDVTKCRIYLKNFGEFFKNQVQAAGTIVLSRMDTPKATPERVEEALHLLRELNPNATIITTPVAELGGKKVLETMQGKKIDLSLVEDDDHEHHHHDHDHDHDDDECCCHDHDHEHHHDDDDECCCHDHEHHHDDDDECCCHDDDHEHHHHDDDHEHHHDHDHACCCHDDEHGHHHHDHHGHHHHHADEVFDAWGQETVRKYAKEEIQYILESLSDESVYGNVLRAKGMVEGTDGSWIYFDMVPEEVDVRTGDPEYTGRICVIGAELKEDKLAKLFGLA